MVIFTFSTSSRMPLRAPRLARSAIRLVCAAVTALAVVACTGDLQPTVVSSPSPSLEPTTDAETSPSLEVTIVQEGLSIPWDIAFAPDGRMFVSERSGRVRVFASGQPNAELLEAIEVPDVRAMGEAGVMGMDFDQDFDQHPYLYVCASRDADGEAGDAPWRNELLRFRVVGSEITFDGQVFESRILANRRHNGCGVETDLDGRIWMTVGDALGARDGLPQLDNLNGKVLRVNRDGTVPEDNPILFGRVGLPYSIGHRNPQGIALDPAGGAPYTAEHGPHVNDEVNRIVAGGNYGWPCYSGRDTPPDDIGGHERLAIQCGEPADYLPPAWASGEATIATSGIVMLAGEQWGSWEGNLIVATLKQSDLRRFVVREDGTLELAETLLDNEFGRLRAVVLGTDGALYVTSSNAPNLGQEGMTPAPERQNDVIVRIVPVLR